MQLPRKTTSLAIASVPLSILGYFNIFAGSSFSDVSFIQLTLLFFVAAGGYWAGYHFFVQQGKSSVLGVLFYTFSTIVLMSLVLRSILQISVDGLFVPNGAWMFNGLGLSFIQIEPWFYHIYLGAFGAVVGFTSVLFQFPENYRIRSFVFAGVGSFIYTALPGIVWFTRLFHPTSITPTSDWTWKIQFFETTGDGVLFFTTFVLFLISFQISESYL